VVDRQEDGCGAAPVAGREARRAEPRAGREAHRIAAWRDEFVDGGKEGLKGKRVTTEDDRRLRDAERKIGELTLENEIWKKVAEKRGLQMPPQKRPR
jgi:hypothetical protein